MRVLACLLVTASSIVVLAAASCHGPQVPAAGRIGGDTVSARAAIARLEADARALVRFEGCAAASQCRTAPVGARPCGGPRTYLAYCAATTDSVALFKKLDELKAAETKFHQAAGLSGTCDFLMPPTVSAEAGSCRLTTP